MIRPGLERIGRLLKDTQFPWKAIHVAGTNGKGSICAHASNLLAARSVPVGRFTSPHLVHRWDCIQINGVPVKETFFKRVEGYVHAVDRREGIDASEFELLTATAFHIFNEAQVQVGVVEVGMGGKLDATNILNNQAVSVIAKIARDHEAFLGNTIEEITRHKAGILRPNVPYLVNPMNEWNVHEIIEEVAKEVGAGPFVHADKPDLDMVWNHAVWKKKTRNMMPFQLDNVVLAYLAVVEAFKALGHSYDNWRIRKLASGLNPVPFPGRLQRKLVPGIFGPAKRILIDGAHNNDSAKALRQYVDKNLRAAKAINPKVALVPRDGWPVTWVIAMSDQKDANSVLAPLLREGDTVVTTSFGPVDGMPWVKPMDPQKIVAAVEELDPDMTAIPVPRPGVHRALTVARLLSPLQRPVVLTGSLYLVGEFLRELENESQLNLPELLAEEREHIGRIFSPSSDLPSPRASPRGELESLEAEMRALNQQLQQFKLGSEKAGDSTGSAGRIEPLKDSLTAGSGEDDTSTNGR